MALAWAKAKRTENDRQERNQVVNALLAADVAVGTLNCHEDDTLDEVDVADISSGASVQADGGMLLAPKLSPQVVPKQSPSSPQAVPKLSPS
mmetsp:Transcript_77338/g.153444  ORF Transcript_77338/g.153444 Transcript_77338/m.153444 type:complete len:92 (+) Transcript_77338:76-351(+)